MTSVNRTISVATGTRPVDQALIPPLIGAV
jgi:hypothetical protein